MVETIGSGLAALAPAPYEDRAYWQRVAAAPASAELVAAMLEAAAALPAEPRAPSGDDYLAALRDNDRRRVDNAWGTLRRDLGLCATRRCILGPDGTTDSRLLDVLWLILCQPCWSAAAHLDPKELPDLWRPHLDLGACMTALIVAECHEILRGWMDAISSRLGDDVVHVLRERVLTPFVELPADEQPWWAQPERVHNNWTGVCAGCILGAVCALERHGLRHDAAKDKALDLLALFLERGFTPSGECDEGPGYWSYGLGSACLGLMRCEPALLAQRLPLDRLAQVASYPRRAHLFGDTFYAANDGLPGLRPQLSWVPWLARLTGDAWLADWVRGAGLAIGAADGSARIKASSGWGQVPWRQALASELLAAAPVGAGWPPAPGGTLDLPDQQVLLRRTPRLVATLSGGHNAQCHNHNDVGQVNVWCDGVDAVLDLGVPDYTSDFFSARRYEHLAARSRGHNVPLVAGHEQRPGRDAAASPVGDDGIEGAAAYPEAAGLQRWERRLGTDGEAIVVEDRFAAAPGSAIELRFWCRHEPLVDAAGVRVGPLRVQAADTEPAVERILAGEHRLRLAPAQQPLWCLCLRARCDRDGTLALATRFAAEPEG